MSDRYSHTATPLDIPSVAHDKRIRYRPYARDNSRYGYRLRMHKPTPRPPRPPR